MTRLELVKRLMQEAGISFTGPSSTLAQTGENLMFVQYIDAAYAFIQGLHDNWFFLLSDVSVSLTSGTASYSPESDLRSWKTDDCRVYSEVDYSDEQQMVYVPWATFKRGLLIGTNRTATGTPYYFSTDRDNKLWVSPVPDGAYTFVGEYVKAADKMTANDDEPLFPEQYHMVLVWKAMLDAATKYGMSEKLAHATTEYARLLHELEMNQLPAVRFMGKSLA